MAKIVERDRGMMSAGQFRQEHLLEFAGSGDCFFSMDAIDAMFSPAIQPLRLVA